MAAAVTTAIAHSCVQEEQLAPAVELHIAPIPNLKYRQDQSAGISSYVYASGILFVENVF